MMRAPEAESVILKSENMGATVLRKRHASFHQRIAEPKIRRHAETNKAAFDTCVVE